jgi:hypothetical protein
MIITLCEDVSVHEWDVGDTVTTLTTFPLLIEVDFDFNSWLLIMQMWVLLHPTFSFQKGRVL